jgi:hypothetical protein
MLVEGLVVAFAISLVMALPFLYAAWNFFAMTPCETSQELLMDGHSRERPRRAVSTDVQGQRGNAVDDEDVAFLHFFKSSKNSVLDLYDVDVACMNRHLYRRHNNNVMERAVGCETATNIELRKGC